MQNSAEKQNSEYLDLYGDYLKSEIVLNENPTLELIKSYFPETCGQERIFKYGDKKIIAQRKFTYKRTGNNMLVKTNFLHILVQREDLKIEAYTHYRETRNNQFKAI